jgi:hypothetical protein
MLKVTRWSSAPKWKLSIPYYMSMRTQLLYEHENTTITLSWVLKSAIPIRFCKNMAYPIRVRYKGVQSLDRPAMPSHIQCWISKDGCSLFCLIMSSQEAASEDPVVQLNAVQAARLILVNDYYS